MRLARLALPLPLLLATCAAQADTMSKEGSASLQFNEAGNLLIGTVEFGRSFQRDQDLDLIVLPECNSSSNSPVSAVRFVAPERKANGTDNGTPFVESFAIIFGDGATQETHVREQLKNGQDADGTGWFDIKGGHRCIRAIGVLGAQRMNDARRMSGAQVRVMGRR